MYRLRRDGRRAVEDIDRVRASLHAPDPKMTTKNPTRLLPDVAGNIDLILIRSSIVFIVQLNLLLNLVTIFRICTFIEE